MRQYSTYAECEEAAYQFSLKHPGHYYVSVVDSGCYEVSSLSEYDGEPYYQNGEVVYPDY